MRFEEERVACSMVRGEKNSKRPPLLSLRWDGLFGRASSSPRSIRRRHGRHDGTWQEFATSLSRGLSDEQIRFRGIEKSRKIHMVEREEKGSSIQPADIGCSTGNGEKLSSSQAQLNQVTGLAVA